MTRNFFKRYLKLLRLNTFRFPSINLLPSVLFFLLYVILTMICFERRAKPHIWRWAFMLGFNSYVFIKSLSNKKLFIGLKPSPETLSKRLREFWLASLNKAKNTMMTCTFVQLCSFPEKNMIVCVKILTEILNIFALANWTWREEE